MDYRLSIRDWPADQRPRDRLLELGPDVLSDVELLAIILRTGNTETSAVDLAQAILTRWGGFRGLDRIAVAVLCSIPGIGPAKAAQLKAAITIGKRLALEDDSIREHISTSDDVYRRVALKLRDQTREVFLVIFLTSRNTIIKERALFEGTLTESMVSPREVIKEALEAAAASLVFVHNHPSHDPSPSSEDRLLTHRLKDACNLVGVSVLDHVIVGGNRYFSFADEGIL